MYDKPLPIVDPDTEPFWTAAREHTLLLKRCATCGRAHFYPRALCPGCHSDDVAWVESRGAGTIYSFTIARRPAGPAFEADTPYVVALVDLDEGARMLTNIVGCSPDDVRIGQRVQVEFRDVTPEVTLPMFRLI